MVTSVRKFTISSTGFANSEAGRQKPSSITRNSSTCGRMQILE